MFLSISGIPYRTQWQAGLTLAYGAVIIGTSVGWTSPYMAKLTAPNSTNSLKITYSEASWMVSIHFLGGSMGAILGAIIQDFIGRKKTLLFASVPFAVASIVVPLSPTLPSLYASRILAGLTLGLLFTTYGPFLGEIADPKIRGSLIILVMNGLTVGELLGTIMGGLLPMETFSFVTLGLITLFAAAFLFVPESPYYQIAKGEYKEAEKLLRWYNGSANVEREMRDLQELVGSRSVSVAEKLKEAGKPQNLKNFVIVFFLSIFPYCSGLNSTEPYAEIILTASKIDLTPKIVVMGLTFCAMIAGIVVLILVDKFGRRVLLMGSGIGVGIGHILLGLHFHMLSLGIEAQSISWLPVFSLFLVYFSMPSGLSTVICPIVSEIFPPILKTPAAFLFTVMSGVMSFAISKCFEPYRHFVGEKFVFWTFATFALASVVFSYLNVPETTRMSLKDIQDNFKKDSEDIEVSAVDVETNISVNN